MAAQFVFGAVLDDRGKVHLDDKPKWDEAARSLRDRKVERVEVVLRKPKSKRSLDQNAYWWAVPVALLAEHCGNTPNQMHYALLGECFGYVPGMLGRLAVPAKSSSSDLTVDEFKHLIDWVLIFGPTELGVSIPCPDEWLAAA